MVFIVAPVAVLLLSCGGGDLTLLNPPITLSSITIDSGSRNIELGTTVIMTATAKDAAGKTVNNLPYVWKSTIDSIGHFGLNGALMCRDTGVTVVTASALGVTAGAIGVHCTRGSAARIDTFHFSPPNAINPGVSPIDSIRVLVRNPIGGPGTGSLVLFSVTAGGGTVSPKYDTVTNTGIVAAKWTLGPTAGLNTVTATIVSKVDSVTALTYVTGNPVTFSVKSFAPLAIIAGDGQTGPILSALSVKPSVKLVDTAGNPRPGIPITFTPTGNGRVATSVVPTGVDGVASPSIWTLGDFVGDQQLVASVEAAKITLHATATGGTVHYAAIALAATQTATCALTNDQFVSCFGQAPQIGTGDAASRSIPTLTKGGIHFTSIVGASSGAHFCGISDVLAIYCWGINADVDTTGAVPSTNVPTRLPGNTAWLQVTAGGQHNCAIASDHTAYCWGSDGSGQLGDNGTTDRFAPGPVAGGFKFNSLTAGAAHTCALIADGTAFCWGLNQSAQLGDGTGANRGGPTAVSGGLKFQAIAAAGSGTCGLSGGTAYCWGALFGQSVPTSYPSAPPFSSIAAGNAHACALTSDGTAYCWGNNSAGQLGDSTTTNRTTPTVVVTDLKFKAITAGSEQTCALTVDGFVACWGRNQFGEIGVTVPTIQTTPRYLVFGVTP
ncbi:MAG: hypothetical protein ABI442_17600 [Gemmatimonadaceae bacterium]